MIRYLILLMLTLFCSGQASAASYSFDLNCYNDGGSCDSSTGNSWGTVTIADNAVDSNRVNVTVDLFGTASKFKDFLLNYGGTTATAFHDYSSYDSDLNFSPDGLALNPFNSDYFDLQGSTANGGTPDPFTFILGATNNGSIIDLNATDFLFKTSANALYLALHIQDCQADTPLCSAGSSIKVGATNYNENGPGIVPVPAAVWLFGTGLLGLIGAARRKSSSLQA